MLTTTNVVTVQKVEFIYE